MPSSLLIFPFGRVELKTASEPSPLPEVLSLCAVLSSLEFSSVSYRCLGLQILCHISESLLGYIWVSLECGLKTLSRASYRAHPI